MNQMGYKSFKFSKVKYLILLLLIILFYTFNNQNERIHQIMANIVVSGKDHIIIYPCTSYSSSV